MADEEHLVELIQFDLAPGTAPGTGGEAAGGARANAPAGKEQPRPEFLDLMQVWWDAPQAFPRDLNVFRQFSSVPNRCRGGVVAIGKFDGLHIGHRALIEVAARKADELGAPLGVVTFEPHPRAVFEPDAQPFRLDTTEARARLLAELGVDVLLNQSFDREFAQLSAEEFVQQVLIDGMQVSHVVVGYDFRFGKQRRGDPQMLIELGEEKGFGVTVVDQVTVGGEVAGSTSVRAHISAGRPRAAARILGRPWEIEGTLRNVPTPGGEARPAVPLGAHQMPAAGWYVVTVATAAHPEAGWHTVQAEIGAVQGEVLFAAPAEAGLAALTGQNVRVAFVDYLGDARDGTPLESDA